MTTQPKKFEPGCWLVAAGDTFCGGFTLFGPFKTAKEAEDWMEEYKTWNVVETKIIYTHKPFEMGTLELK